MDRIGLGVALDSRPVSFRRGGLTGIALPEFVDWDVEALPWKALSRKGELPEGVTAAKRSKSRLVLATIRNDELFYVKRGIARTWKHKISVRLQGTKLRREWDVAREFRELGIIVPEPVYYAEDSERRAYMATRAFPADWQPIDLLFKARGISQEILDELAAYTMWLHALPAYHDDYRTDHIYWTNAPDDAALKEKFALLDLDGSSVGKRVSKKMREEALYELFLSLARRGFTLEQAARFGERYDAEVDAGAIFGEAMREFGG